jgi:hypothetical protein
VQRAHLDSPPLASPASDARGSLTSADAQPFAVCHRTWYARTPVSGEASHRAEPPPTSRPVTRAGLDARSITVATVVLATSATSSWLSVSIRSVDW